MYHLSPFTYLIEGLLGQAIGQQQINCSPVEIVMVRAPAGQTCGQYMANYIERAGGYLTDPSSSGECGFCSFRDTDQFLAASFNIYYDHRWRDFGILAAFILLNVSLYCWVLIRACADC